MYSSANSSKLLTAFCKSNGYDIIRHHNAGFWDVKIPIMPAEQKSTESIKEGLKRCGYRVIFEYTQSDRKLVMHIIPDREATGDTAIPVTIPPVENTESVGPVTADIPLPVNDIKETEETIAQEEKPLVTKWGRLKNYCNKHQYTLEKNRSHSKSAYWVVTMPKKPEDFAQLKKDIYMAGYTVTTWWENAKGKMSVYVVPNLVAEKIKASKKEKQSQSTPKGVESIAENAEEQKPAPDTAVKNVETNSSKKEAELQYDFMVRYCDKNGYTLKKRAAEGFWSMVVPREVSYSEIEALRKDFAPAGLLVNRSGSSCSAKPYTLCISVSKKKPLCEEAMEAILACSKIKIVDEKPEKTTEQPKTEPVLSSAAVEIMTDEEKRRMEANMRMRHCIHLGYDDERSAYLKLLKAVLSQYAMHSELRDAHKELKALEGFYGKIGDIQKCYTYRGVPVASGFFTVTTRCLRVTIADFLRPDDYIRMDELIDEYAGGNLIAVGVNMEKYGVTA